MSARMQVWQPPVTKISFKKSSSGISSTGQWLGLCFPPFWASRWVGRAALVSAVVRDSCSSLNARRSSVSLYGTHSSISSLPENSTDRGIRCGYSPWGQGKKRTRPRRASADTFHCRGHRFGQDDQSLMRANSPSTRPSAVALEIPGSPARRQTSSFQRRGLVWPPSWIQDPGMPNRKNPFPLFWLLTKYIIFLYLSKKPLREETNMQDRNK